jgi:hypothetical protein
MYMIIWVVGIFGIKDLRCHGHFPRSRRHLHGKDFENLRRQECIAPVLMWGSPTIMGHFERGIDDTIPRANRRIANWCFYNL